MLTRFFGIPEPLTQLLFGEFSSFLFNMITKRQFTSSGGLFLLIGEESQSASFLLVLECLISGGIGSETKKKAA